MSSILADLPLFPLHTVLFPDGMLPLKIFEARYLDMMRDCLREQSPFGVCMIKSGNEVARPDEPTVPENVGCLAHLLDCDVQEYGLMQIKVKGGQRFRLLSTRVEPSGLLRGMAEPIGEDPMPAGTHHLAAHAACAEVLERIIKGVAERDPSKRAVPAALSFRRSDLAIEPARRDPADSAARTAEAHGNRGCRGAASISFITSCSNIRCCEAVRFRERRP